ncbi:MAG: hypothetical protein U0835_00040 [Isosphaeraceae bacterium]
MWDALAAAVVAFLKALLSLRRKDPETTAAENALAAKQHEAEVLAAPLPDDAELDRIVHRHQFH